MEEDVQLKIGYELYIYLSIYIGSHPVPAALESPFRSTSQQQQQQWWWDHILPGNEQERRWSRSSSADAAGMPAGWSLFDDKKLSLGMGIAAHAAVFLRLVSSDLQRRVRSVPDMLQLIKISLVADVFCKCSALSLQLSVAESAAGGGGGRDDDATGIAWLRSPLPVSIRSSTPFTAVMDNKSKITAALLDVETVLQRHKGDSSSSYVISSGVQLSPAGGKLVVSEKLLLVAENLMCVIHNSLAASTARSSHQQRGGYVDSMHLQSHEVDSIRRALDAASSHPPHTFIAQAARWTKDLLA